MKIVLFSLIAISLLVLITCEKERNEPMVIIKDCTGAYLRQNGKDYHICNTDKVARFSDGEDVIATYKRIELCSGSAIREIVCARYHESVGWIEIMKIE